MRIEELSPTARSTPAKQTQPQSASEAATEFESLLVGEMLKTMREGKAESWLGGESSAGSESVMEMAEQQVARAIARSGGFGIAKMLEKSLEKENRGGVAPAANTKVALTKAS